MSFSFLNRIKNKWVLFALSAAATLLLLCLIFLLFLRGPFAALFAKQGADALAVHNYPKAANRYALSLQLKKNNEAVYSGYADALSGLQDHEGAQEILDLGIARISGAESLYLQKAQLYSAQGKIGEAASFLDAVENSYIAKKLQDRRPAALIYAPAQGRYGTAQKITLQVRAGETIYYTLNGETPTTSSAVYTAPITVSATSTLTALAVNGEGLVSPLLKLTYEIDNANEAITFADGKIERMVRAALNQQSGALYAARLASVTALSNEGIDGEIRSLKDLEYLHGLTSLYLDGEYLIEDYSPLAALPALSGLTLSDCGISDAELGALSACSTLTGLYIHNNHITTLDPLRSLLYLEELDAADNEIISAAAVAELPLLTYLNLSGNGLTHAEELAGATALTVLDLSHNRISDLTPLAGLTELAQLSIAGNTPGNIKKLTALPKLISLDVSSCGLTSLSVVNDFPALQVLFAEDNQIASLSTFRKPITELYLNRNPLVDLSPLQGQAELMVLEASGTQIDAVDFLAGHPKLITLDVSGTKVTDATVLKTCTALNLLVCNENCKTEGLGEAVTVVTV